MNEFIDLPWVIIIMKFIYNVSKFHSLFWLLNHLFVALFNFLIAFDIFLRYLPRSDRVIIVLSTKHLLNQQ
jgi:hypothetical protein